MTKKEKLKSKKYKPFREKENKTKKQEIIFSKSCTNINIILRCRRQINT